MAVKVVQRSGVLGHVPYLMRQSMRDALVPSGYANRFAREGVWETSGHGSVFRGGGGSMLDVSLREQRRSLKLWERSECERERRKQTDRVVVYRGKWMRPFRLVVRLKLFQLAGVAALVIPLAHWSQHGNLPLTGLLASGAVVGGAGAASAALWYYSRRYVGEMALTPDLRRVKISVMDFWGNRKDLDFDVRQVVPPLKGLGKEELRAVANQVLTPLDVVGGRQFVVSLKLGQVVNKELLLELLHGTVGVGGGERRGSGSKSESGMEPKS